MEAISEADDPDAVGDTLEQAATALGFPFTQLMVAVCSDKTLPFVLQSRSNKRLEFDRAIILSSDLSSPYDVIDVDPCLDPVIARMKESPLPVVWDESTYTRAGLGEVRDWCVEKGRHHGISIEVPVSTSPGSPRLAVAVSLQRRDPIRQAEVGEVSAHVMLMAAHAAAAARRILVPRMLSIRQIASPLTPTMREYLIWAERGKTAIETAQIVGRKYSTVKNVLAEAMERIGCSGKTQAIQLSRANGWL